MIDVSDAAGLRAEAERRQRLRAQHLPLTAGLNADLTSDSNGRIVHAVMMMDDRPMVVRIPWSYLISDNAKYGVLNGRIILTKRYRAAKARIRELARDQLPNRVPYAQPVRLQARVYVPNANKRDVANYGKCVHDALEGVCYSNDAWIDSVTWLRAGVDVDAPRVELSVYHLPVGGA
jgi:Holliday junction resolvase RusA-like endonuclease